MKDFHERTPTDDWFGKVFDEGPLGMAFIGLDHRFLRINTRLASMLGYTIDELEKLTFHEITHPDDLDSDLQLAAQLVEGEIPFYVIEKRYFKKDGHVIWGKLTGSLMRDDENKPQYYLGMVEDITSCKEAELALRESESRFNTFMDNSPSLVFIRDEQGRYLFANRRLEKLYQTPLKELREKTLFDRVSPGFADTIQANDDAVRKAQRPMQFEEHLDEGNGVASTWLTSKFPLKGPGGQNCIAGVAIDISQRKQIEAELKERDERLQALREIDRAILATTSARDVGDAVVKKLPQFLPCDMAIIFTFDFERQKSKVLAVHEQVESAKDRFRGVSSLMADLPQQSDPDSLPNELLLSEYSNLLEIADDHPWAKNLWEQGLVCGMTIPLLVHGEGIGQLQIWSRQLVCYTPYHREVALDIANSLAVAIAQANLRQTVLETSEGLKSVSRRLVEVQEQERRNLARELHDQVGQDLTAIKMTLELGNREEFKLASAVSRSQTLVNDLMSRVRQLAFDLRPAMLDDLGLIPALVWHFERYFSQTRINVVFKHLNMERRFEPAVETATYRIVQEALTNVARHAGVEQATVRLWVNDSSIGVQIEDKGRGFMPENEKSWSQGLGLASMRERAQLLQGHLTVESIPREGTCITAEIPLRPCAD